MPIADPVKRSLAQRRRLYFKICRVCSARNPPGATRCRKCGRSVLRWKKREIVSK